MSLDADLSRVVILLRPKREKPFNPRAGWDPGLENLRGRSTGKLVR